MKRLIIRISYLCFFVLFFTVSVFSQDWVFQARGISGAPLIPTVFNNITEDPNGNILLTSSVQDSTAFGPFVIHGTPVAPGIFLNAHYLAKFNATGVPQWVKTFTGTGQFIINDLSVDSEGNPIVLGTLSGEVTIDGTTFESAFSQGDFLLVKFDPIGNLDWAFQAESQPGFSRSAGVSVDVNSDDDIITSGVVESNVNFGGVVIENASNLIMASFDKDGGMDWVRTYGFFYQVNTATEVSVDSEDNICWVGATANNAAGDPTVFDTISFQAYNSSMFVAKFDPEGNVMWLNHYGEDPDPNALAPLNSNNLTIDFLTDDLILTGTFRDTVSMDGFTLTEPTFTGTHLFVARFTGNGTLEWVKQSHGVANFVDVFDIDANDMGSVFVGMQVASSQGLSDFILGEGANEQSFEINGSDNGILAKFDASGELDWIKGNSGFGFSPIFAVDATANGGALISGIFSEMVQIGDSSLTPGPLETSSNVYLANCSGGTTSIQNLNGQEINLIVFPNPASDKINVAWEQSVECSRIQLLDVNGKVIVEQTKPRSMTVFTTGHLPVGVYFVKAETDLGAQVKKVVVQR